MTNSEVDYLLGRPAQGYRAGTVDADAVLISPDGQTIATFLDLDDAIHAADALNRAADDAAALALAAWAFEKLGPLMPRKSPPPHQNETSIELYYVSRGLMAVNAAPGRAVGAIATGPGGGL